MNALEVTRCGPDGERSQATLACAEPVWIGRAPECHVVLNSELVSRRHVCVEAGARHLSVRDCSANGTRVDGCLLHGQRRDVGSSLLLEIGPYRLQVRLLAAHNAAAPTPSAQAAAPDPLRRRIQRRLLDNLDLGRRAHATLDTEHMRPEVVAALTHICESFDAELPDPHARRNLVRELADEALGLGPLERFARRPAGQRDHGRRSDTRSTSSATA